MEKKYTVRFRDGRDYFERKAYFNTDKMAFCFKYAHNEQELERLQSKRDGHMYWHCGLLGEIKVYDEDGRSVSPEEEIEQPMMQVPENIIEDMKKLREFQRECYFLSSDINSWLERNGAKFGIDAADFFHRYNIDDYFESRISDAIKELQSAGKEVE